MPSRGVVWARLVGTCCWAQRTEGRVSGVWLARVRRIPARAATASPRRPLRFSTARVGFGPGRRRFLALRTRPDGSRLKKSRYVPFPPSGAPLGDASWGGPRSAGRVPAPRASPVGLGARPVLVLSDAEDPVCTGGPRPSSLPR